MLLTKERSLNDSKESRLIEANQTIEKLRKELESTVPQFANTGSVANRVIRAPTSSSQQQLEEEMEAKEQQAQVSLCVCVCVCAHILCLTVFSQHTH